MPSFHNLFKSALCLVLFGILSGCTTGQVVNVIVDAATIPSPDANPYSHRTGKNHYEPVVLASKKDWIRVKYLSVGPNAEHEQVVQLIVEHCEGTYIETNRTEARGYTTVNAECANGIESLQ